MKKIILFLVCAIACVGIAFGLNQNSQMSTENEKIILERENKDEIDKQKDTENIGAQDKVEKVEKIGDTEKGEKNKEAEKEIKVNNENEIKVNDEKEVAKKDDEETSKENNQENEQKVEVPKKKEVSISINAQKAVEYGINKESGFTHIPANGVLLGEQKVEIKEGETVFDILMKVIQKTKLHMEYTGGGSAIYIEGIDNLYEFDCGKFSGWMYSVNGVYPNYGVGAYKVKDGDKITFNYTCDLGRDLGAPVR
ncbi:MAG: DUF4430 domain-containing protein [Clostridium sp.]|uniref:DUF4430 domain-containing protein n=1 Tax=Clostridium sp. TaxID=1506 RepID=UPI003F32BCDB